MVQPKKRLGQHFLTDPAIARRIVDSLDIPPGDPVMEIGPGKGILTEFLLEKSVPLYLVEIDTESVEYLTKRWPSLSERIIRDDVLNISWNTITEGPLHIIGNFPYNISSQIFFRVLKYRSHVNQVVCMIQKEVATRLASPPGSKDYGILSVLLQAYFDLEFLFTVKPGSFFPPPKVHSGVIRLQRNNTRALDCNEDLFFTQVKTSFNQRRKTIRNSLKAKLLNLDRDWEILSKRPEQLAVSDFVELTHMIESAGISQNP